MYAVLFTRGWLRQRTKALGKLNATWKISDYKRKTRSQTHIWYKGKDAFLLESFTLISINSSDRIKYTTDPARPGECPPGYVQASRES